jgi:UDP-N-acetylmuramoyl-tripeptide--D-alanyl-D-alanine ligase
VNQDDIQLGLRLGSQFLVRSQRDAGNFRYEYNWLTQKETEEDNPVRQAGTLWGLTTLHLDDPQTGLLPAIRKGLQYFEKHSKDFSGGRRLMIYPGQEPQKLGAVALLALSHIEVLRRPEALESPEEKKTLEAHLEGYLKAILAARTGKNNFYKFYDGKTGRAFGPTSPYYDGECLLALVKAAKYLGHNYLLPDIKVSAQAGWKKNVRLGLKITEAEDRDQKKLEMDAKKKDKAMKRMKGYYQWGSMAWYELMGLEDPVFSKYAPRMLRYSEWNVIRAPKSGNVNTGYAFEGLIPAFVIAVKEGDMLREQKFACAIRQGMDVLHSLQVGHSRARLGERLLGDDDADNSKDERAQGGAQGSRGSPALRIDTTQHQLHALLMAKRLLQQKVLI